MAIETWEDGLAALARRTQWARIIVWIFVAAWAALSLMVAWGGYSGTNLEEAGGIIGTTYGGDFCVTRAAIAGFCEV